MGAEFRLRMTMREDRILSTKIELGYQHRNLETLLQKESLFQNLPRISRLTAHAPLSHELAFLKSMESLLELEVPLRSQLIRVLFCEGERIISHLMNLGRMAYGAGLSYLLNLALDFKDQYERLCEKIFHRRIFFEIFALGGLKSPISTSFLSLWVRFFEQALDLLEVFEVVLLKNRTFRDRTCRIGLLDKEKAQSFGWTGPNARAVGIPLDIRTLDADAVYEEIDFRPILFQEGHAFSRTLLRFEEIKQSLQLMKACLKKIPHDSPPHKPEFTDSKKHHISLD
ncbi:hypothetical protein AGMMS49949_07170 [Alphaproteobacteria bacterium]|nr:hypothetical protein AGMMS49949_07170 [Alphaproteobacteria bacterium]GHS98672.1 hypothetical protein AGMMS50296_6480 [Alphaproteobacteria bacterium]